MCFSQEKPVKRNAFGRSSMRMSPMRALGVALFLLVLAESNAHANDAVETFYKGKTITSVVPFGPGGGYAIYSQIMARHLGKFIPGNPQIVLQYRPGAGGIVASNYVYNAAPRDGSVMAMVSDRRCPGLGHRRRQGQVQGQRIHLARRHRTGQQRAGRARRHRRARRSRICSRRRSSSAVPAPGSPTSPAAGAAALARA